MLTTASQSTANQYVTFRVAELLLGIEVEKVQEVLRYQTLTAVPLAPYAVEGLINLRGQIVVAIDTRRSLGLPAVSAGMSAMHIVLHGQDGPVSLLVDEIHDVTYLPLNARAPVPDNMAAARRSLLSCVYNLAGGLVLILDTARLLEDACTNEPAIATTSTAPLLN
jgi:purine-binding chemotaxis protein CheW